MSVRRTLAALALLLGLSASGAAQYRSPAVVTDPFAERSRVEADLTAARAEFETAAAESTRTAAELTALRPAHERAREGFKQRVRALYRMQHASRTPLDGGFDALLSHLARMEHLERVVEREARNVEYLDRRVRALDEASQRASQRRDTAEARVRGLEARRDEIEATMGELLDDPWLAAGGSAASPGHLGVAPLPSSGPVVLSGSGTSVSMQSAQPVSGFAALRGRLGAPVLRVIEVRDAVRDDGPGLEFLTAEGAAVLAVAEGRVAYSGQHGSYGRMIILEHGDAFYTVYGGLAELAVHVGDVTVRGTRLGTVARAAQPAVFFEVRRSTRTLDPRSWTGLMN